MSAATCISERAQSSVVLRVTASSQASFGETLQGTDIDDWIGSFLHLHILPMSSRVEGIAQPQQSPESSTTLANAWPKLGCFEGL